MSTRRTTRTVIGRLVLPAVLPALLLAGCGDGDGAVDVDARGGTADSAAPAGDEATGGDPVEFAGLLGNLSILDLADVSWPEATPAAVGSAGGPAAAVEGTLVDVGLADEAQRRCPAGDPGLRCIEAWSLEVTVAVEQAWGDTDALGELVSIPITLAIGLGAEDRGPYDPDPHESAQAEAEPLTRAAPLGGRVLAFVVPSAIDGYDWQAASPASLVLAGRDGTAVITTPESAPARAGAASTSFAEFVARADEGLS